MGVITKTLIDNGFTMIGLCQVCYGRAWDMRYDGDDGHIQCKVRFDQNNNDTFVTFTGFYKGRMMRNETAVVNTLELKLKEIGIIQNNDGNTTTTD